MNIGSGLGYPSANLSNFHPHAFTIDGIHCSSMEGFLQSLKFKNPEMQVEVCKMVGYQAKRKGSGKNRQWKQSQTLHWQGVEYPRKSKEYQELLDRAYDALAINKKFQRALIATNNATLTHSIGRTKESETILTIREFCSRLTKIRARLQKELSEC